MKSGFYFFIFIFFICIACNENRKKTSIIAEAEKTIANETMHTPADFSKIEICYATLINAIKQKNDMIFDQLISEKGLFIISSLNDQCEVNKYYHINQFVSNDKRFFDTHRPLPFTKFIRNQLPKLDCRKKNHYNKNGSFGSDTNMLKVTSILKYCKLKDCLDTEILTAAQDIDYTIINTQIGVFYFASENDQWKLIFLDLRNPCVD